MATCATCTFLLVYDAGQDEQGTGLALRNEQGTGLAFAQMRERQTRPLFILTREQGAQ